MQQKTKAKKKTKEDVLDVRAAALQKAYGLYSYELMKMRILWKAVAQLYSHALGNTPEGKHWLEVSLQHWKWMEEQEERDYGLHK
jgi:hypothetical protein